MKTLKERLSAKLSKEGGFTLVEMLIVVAIIAILIMVSIPLISTTLEKARLGVDQANERTAMSMASAAWLTEFTGADGGKQITYFYVIDANHQGEVTRNRTGDVKVADANFKYGESKDNIDSGVKVVVGTDGKIVSVDWIAVADATADPS